MKKNLEVPPFFKGNSFDALDPGTLICQTAKMNIDIGSIKEECVKIVEEMIDSEKVNCLAFANNNPEIMLRDTLK